MPLVWWLLSYEFTHGSNLFSLLKPITTQQGTSVIQLCKHVEIGIKSYILRSITFNWINSKLMEWGLVSFVIRWEEVALNITCVLRGIAFLVAKFHLGMFVTKVIFDLVYCTNGVFLHMSSRSFRISYNGSKTSIVAEIQ